MTGLESIILLFDFSLSSLFLPSFGLAKHFKNYLILSLLLAYKQNKLYYAFCGFYRGFIIYTNLL